MAVKISGALGILSNAQLSKMDSIVSSSSEDKIKLDQVIQRIKKLEQEQVLPRSTLRKNRKELETGLAGGRQTDSNKKAFRVDKIRPEFGEEKSNRTQDFLLALGLTSKKKQLLNASLVAGTGPLAGFTKNAFKDLQSEVGKLKKAQTAIAQHVSSALPLIGGASGLQSVRGITSILFSQILKFGLPVAIVAMIAQKVFDEFKSKYGKGGTRDTRVLVKANDTSLIGEENENFIASGEILFISNPNVLQGLPRGKSNTQELRNDRSRYKQRHEGSYT